MSCSFSINGLQPFFTFCLTYVYRSNCAPHRAMFCARFSHRLCVELSDFLNNTTKYQLCFKKDGFCFVTFREAMNQDANRHLCSLLPKNSTMPTPSDTVRQQKFGVFLQNAQRVTWNQPVWIDVHREAPPPQSEATPPQIATGSLIITTAINLETKSY